MRSPRKSLFRDVSSYSLDSYRRELASELTLNDLQGFAERFLSRHRRQLQQKDGFLEFLVPDVLKAFDLPERYRTTTFDRQLAIRRTDAEFLALGHPFVDAMLSYSGSYDFGGLTAVRHIQSPSLAGRSGFLFVFIIRQRITREDGDECLFQFQPVFVSADGKIESDVVTQAVTGIAIENPGAKCIPPDPSLAFNAAKLTSRVRSAFGIGSMMLSFLDCRRSSSSDAPTESDGHPITRHYVLVDYR